MLPGPRVKSQLQPRALVDIIHKNELFAASGLLLWYRCLKHSQFENTLDTFENTLAMNLMIRYKNEFIAELHEEVQRIQDSHRQMVRAYSAKLAEYGIPTEELGFVAAE